MAISVYDLHTALLEHFMDFYFYGLNHTSIWRQTSFPCTCSVQPVQMAFFVLQVWGLGPQFMALVVKDQELSQIHLISSSSQRLGFPDISVGVATLPIEIFDWVVHVHDGHLFLSEPKKIQDQRSIKHSSSEQCKKKTATSCHEILLGFMDNYRSLYIYIYMAVCQNLVPLVNIKIAGKWMFIPLKMVLIGIDPSPYIYIYMVRYGKIPCDHKRPTQG